MAKAALLARVHRTRSGLPLCSACGIELGFCEHSSTNFSIGAGSGAKLGGATNYGAVPAAMALDEAAPAGDEGSEGQQGGEQEQNGRSRKRILTQAQGNGASAGKGKRRAGARVQVRTKRVDTDATTAYFVRSS